MNPAKGHAARATHGQPWLRDRALIADVQGSPAAAISLADDRIVADPYRDPALVRRQDPPATS